MRPPQPRRSSSGGTMHISRKRILVSAAGVAVLAAAAIAAVAAFGGGTSTPTKIIWLTQNDAVAARAAGWVCGLAPGTTAANSGLACIPGNAAKLNAAGGNPTILMTRT